ncbi:MAG: cation diffusion facilitator family transporter [Kiritimatiellae bacterium]|nr:cation diffusion facilitator family transporter [Kiritimatiellia bacterium]
MIPSRNVVVRIRRASFVGMFVNVSIAVLKGVGGVAFSSQALVADAVHSLSDLVTDIAVVLGVRYWTAPADDEHPYGHGKIESLVTLFIAVALAIAAYELGVKAAGPLTGGGAVAPGMGAFFMALVSVFSKEWLFRWTRRVARETKSQALEANAWHHRSDAISSVPVAAAVALAHFFPSLAWADAAGAALVALFVLRVSWQIAKPALQELVDASIEGKAEAVTALAAKVPGVVDVHKARVRRYGGAYSADLHVHVNPRLSVAEGHDIGHAVQDALRASDLGVTDAIVHVEPARISGEDHAA